jgi:hypothetical protein
MNFFLTISAIASSNVLSITSEYEHFIKYLISSLRFIISNETTSYLAIDESSSKSEKSTTNQYLIKRFCEIARDITAIKK